MSAAMSRIARIHAREVYDSRGKPTLEVEVVCAGGERGRAIVPSGASTGQFEAHELRDTQHARLGGAGVLTAVENVKAQLAPVIQGLDVLDQAALDRRLCELDGTPNKSRLGANALLGVSLAAAHAAAAAQRQPLVARLREIWSGVPSVHPPGDPRAASRLRLPLPMVNMISGGLHAGGNLDFQDFLILPVGARSYREALEWIVTVYRTLGRLLTAAGHEGVLVGDEGGYGPKLRSNSEAADFILRAIEAAGLRPGPDVALGLDVASTHFYREGTYQLAATGDARLGGDEMIALLETWVANYPLISIEDGLAEDDWDNWRALTACLGERVQLIGDDLFVTNRRRLEQGIARRVANSVLIKLNQIGTLSETLETLRLALDQGYLPVVSARSGETEDTTIADLVVATGAGQIKVGSVARSERLAKYNQLLRLEEELGAEADYVGGDIFASLRKGAGFRPEA